MPDGGRLSAADLPIRFGEHEWREEIERLRERSSARTQAERSRREIESSKAALDLRKCKAEGDDGTRLIGCVKLYVPLGRQGASEAPFGFVFQLAKISDGAFVWSFLAFGERHPGNPATRTVYERAHRRLYGRYP
jgi:hypothetical protein